MPYIFSPLHMRFSAVLLIFFFFTHPTKRSCLEHFLDSWDDRNECNKELTTEVIKNRQLAAYVSYYISSFIFKISSSLSWPHPFVHLLRNKILKKNRIWMQKLTEKNNKNGLNFERKRKKKVFFRTTEFLITFHSQKTQKCLLLLSFSL